MSTLVLYDEDADGWAAAYAVYAKHGDEFDYLPLSHGSNAEGPPEEVQGYDEIILLDFSWDLEEVFDLAETKRVTIVDHHASFVEQIHAHPDVSLGSDHVQMEAKYEHESSYEATVSANRDDTRTFFTLVYGEKQSAATLAWNFSHNEPAPKLLQHVEDRDLWNWDLDGTDEITLGLHTIGYSFEVFEEYVEDCDGLFDLGQILVLYRDQKVEDLSKHVTTCTIRTLDDAEGITYGLANVPILRSKAGHFILDEYPEVDVAVLYSISIDQASGCPVAYVSLRSREDGPDVSKIASERGGGGHPNAAGYRQRAADRVDFSIL